MFIGDRVIPHFVDGASWKSSVTTLNLEDHPVTFQILFFNDNGTDLYVPVTGQGSVRGMNIRLNTAGSATFETAGTAALLSQGWALLSQATNDSVGMITIFRQSVPGRQDQEAVVPTVNQFDNHFALLFDNTAFTTAIAIANPTINSVIIPVNIRSELGQIIDSRTFSLGPERSHRVYITECVGFHRGSARCGGVPDDRLRGRRPGASVLTARHSRLFTFSKISTGPFTNESRCGTFASPPVNLIQARPLAAHSFLRRDHCARLDVNSPLPSEHGRPGLGLVAARRSSNARARRRGLRHPMEPP